MKEQCNCPYCNADITDFMHGKVISYNRRKQMLASQKLITKERREEMNIASQERLKQWRENNPLAIQQAALKASQSRTQKSFEKQSATIKNTARKKAVRFAELVLQAKQDGIDVTPELENQFMEQAKKDVRQSNKEYKQFQKERLKHIIPTE